ncbi:MAG: hypothetical protein R3F56_10790 [Planctomycetota bacterium]
MVAAALPAQTYYFGFDATVRSPSATQVDYSVRVGNLQGQDLDRYLRAFGGPLDLYVYHVADLVGNDLSRLRAGHFLRQQLRSSSGSFTIPAHDGLTFCYFSLEALPVLWGVAGVYEAGARVPAIPANAPSRIGTVGGAYTSVQNAEQIHNLVNSVIVPLPQATAVELMNGQKTLVLRDPQTGDTRYMQWQPWTHWLNEDNGRRVLKEVVGYFQNKKHGVVEPYYEQLEVHAVPPSQVQAPSFKFHPTLQRTLTARLEARPARGTGSYVFERNLANPDAILVDGALVKVLHYRGSLRPVGAIDSPIPAEHCPIVNLLVEFYSGETFVNVKVLLTNSRFEGTGDFIFDQIRLSVPGAYIRTHNYRPEGKTADVYPWEPNGQDSVALVRPLGGGMTNRLRENGSFLWNAGIFAEFGPRGQRLERAAENLRLYLTQFFGDRSLGANYFDQPFSRGGGIPDLRYQGMMADWKLSWRVPSGINDNARDVFDHYAPRTKFHAGDGSSPYLFPYPCFGPQSGSETGVDEAIMPRNGAVVIAYNANSVFMVEALETALFMGRGALTRQPIDTLFLGDGRPNTLDYMRYRMWEAPGGERIEEARMLAGQYLWNSGNNTRSAFHPNLDFKQTGAYRAHVAEANVPYNELLGSHDTEHCQRYTTHVIESLYKTNPDFLGKIYMDAAAEMMCSLSHYTGESVNRQYTHIPYGSSLWGMMNSPAGSGSGGRNFEAFGLHAEAMFHRPIRQSDVIMAQQMAAIVQRVARPNGYMGCLFGQDARHFQAAEEAGLRSQVSQYLTQTLQQTVGPDDFDLVGVDLRWQGDVWDMLFGSAAKAYLGSALDAEARVVLQAIDRDLIATYTDQFDGAYSTVHGARVHIGLEKVELGQQVFSVPASIKNGQYANMSGGPYERWVFGLLVDLPGLRNHLAATQRLGGEYFGANRNLMLPVSSVGQEDINGAGIQAMWALQQLGM